MAHLLEHLMFKGSPRHPKQDLEANAHGARLGATTSFDRTIYTETFPATPENLSWALDLEADRMLNAAVTRKDLDSEFSVVRNEFENGENNPLSVLFDKSLAAAYQWHNYGKTTIGARADIENVPIDRLQAFYRTYYQPDNSWLVIGGNFDEGKTLDLITKHFGPLRRPTRKLPKFYTAEPTQDGERQVTIRRTGDTQYLLTGYHLPPVAHQDSGALDILWQLLAATPSGRLHKVLVEKKKVSSVASWNASLKEPSFGAFYAELRKDMSLHDARDLLIDTVENIATKPLTAAEVERARINLLKEIELTLNDPEDMTAELSEWAARGDWRLFFLQRDRIKSASLADVSRVAAQYLKPSNRTLAYFIPTEKPERAEIPEVRDSDVATTVKDYKGGALVAAGELFEPSFTNIESRTKRESIGGLKVAFLPKENRGDTVFVSLNLNFGDEKALFNRRTAASFTAGMLVRGTAKHTREQIQDEFDRLRARVSIGGNAASVGVSIETIRQNLPESMRLVAEVLREPAFPENELEQLKLESLANIEYQQGETGAVATNALARHFNKHPKGDVRYVSTFDEQIADVKALTLDDVRQFYKDFYGASNGELAVVGDFDPQTVTTLTSELFGSWRSPRPFARIPKEYGEIAPYSQSIEVADKEGANFESRLDLKIRDDDPDYPALALAGFILGGSFTSRLVQRIREKEGLSYDIDAYIGADPLDQFGGFYSAASYAPQNAEKFEKVFREEVANLLKAGVRPEEVADAKAGLIERYKVYRSHDNTLAGMLSNYLFLGRTFAWDADLERKLKALTPTQVNGALAKHITPAKISIVRAGDFAKAKDKVKD